MTQRLDTLNSSHDELQALQNRVAQLEQQLAQQPALQPASLEPAPPASQSSASQPPASQPPASQSPASHSLGAQQKLQDQTNLLRLILESLSDGVVVVDDLGRFLLFNPAAERMIGIGPAQVDSRDWSKHFGLFLPDGQTLFPFEALPLVRAIRGEEVNDCHLFVRNFQNSEGSLISVNARPLIDPQGTRCGAVAVFRDITEKKKAEHALAAQKQFLEQLLEAHERDRQLMAYEIHDGLVQDITGALMHLESILPAQARSGGNSFDLALNLLRESLDEGRRLIGGLRPPILDEMGVVAAIDYLVGEHAVQGVSAIRFNHDVLFDRLEPLLEGTLFRITQEALTNIKKHSQAPSASVDLSQAGDKVQLLIRDCGVGFDLKKIDKRRFGLKGIRERARLLHGRAKIESEPGKGTRIFVELPITPPLHLLPKQTTP